MKLLNSMIINFEILKSFFDLVVCEKTKLNNNLEMRIGFSYGFKLACKEYNWGYSRYTSKHVEKENGPSNKGSFQINVQTVLAFREIAKGFRPMCTLTSLMNFPPPISVVTYTKINGLLFNLYSKTANESTFNATKDTYEKLLSKGHVQNSDDQSMDCTVFGDGVCSKSGHSSINGLVTLISKENGKCTDSHVVSKKCKGCSIWANKKNSPGYQEWLANHVCLDESLWVLWFNGTNGNC